MEFSDVVQSRYSVRAYKADPVEEQKLQRVLKVAITAPTACNLQPFHLVVIHTRGREAELQRIYPAAWFVQAPVLVCICAIPGNGWARRDGKSYTDVNASIVMDHLILAATDLGLGTCWVGAFDPQAARTVLRIPDGVEIIAFTPLGYPADTPKRKVRRPLGELVSYEHW